MGWENRFDRLLKAMSEGEPHKAEKRASERPRPSEPDSEQSPPDPSGRSER